MYVIFNVAYNEAYIGITQHDSFVSGIYSSQPFPLVLSNVHQWEIVKYTVMDIRHFDALPRTDEFFSLSDEIREVFCLIVLFCKYVRELNEIQLSKNQILKGFPMPM